MKTKIKNHKVLFIAPYEELAVLAQFVRDKYNFDYAINIGNLPGCLELAQKKIDDGFEAIISRGGNVLKIREKFSIPVVEVEINAVDVLKSLKKAMKYDGPIAVVGFPNIINQALFLSDILGITIKETKINSVEETEQVVSRMIDDGICVVVGDRIAVEIAKKHGATGILITTESHECIITAYEKAVEMIEVRQRGMAIAEHIRIITEFTHSGIISIDKVGKINLINAKAKEFLCVDVQQLEGQMVDEIYPELDVGAVMMSKKQSLNHLSEWKGKHVVLHKIPIVIEENLMGVVVTFECLDNIREIEKEARRIFQAKGHVAKCFFNSIVGNSIALRETINRAIMFANVDSTVLINGETGVGKELFAQSIHNASPRKNGPFVVVNCASLPYNLLESELFGYVKGAFTGARIDGKVGLFEQANGGTIFLDEIGEIPLTVQARLLRVLQESQIQRIGDDKIISIDVRIISATNKNLSELIKKNRFREDLYYRINVLNLRIPPLRERIEDIPLLVRFFVGKLKDKYKTTIYRIDDEILVKMCQYNWPGNIRQLENIVERLMVENIDGYLKLENLDRSINLDESLTLEPPINIDMILEEDILNLDSLTANAIEKAMVLASFNKSKAAEILGIDRTTLWRKMKNLNIEDK